MELRRVTLDDSPDRRGWVRLRGDVAYDDRTEEAIWFDVRAADAGWLSRSGNPWLACLAPVAATRGEPLRLARPVDGVLLANVSELLRIWAAWYPDLRAVPIRADTRADTGGDRARGRAACCFSGGVDSLFSVLRHRHGLGSPQADRIDDLVFVHGFDIPVANRAAYERVEASLRRAADAVEARLVPVATNLRETGFAVADWSHVSHGAALAAAGLALERGHDTFLIPSSAGYRDLRRWGSHPLTDPLFSTSALRVVHDGAWYMRAQKTEFVASFEVGRETCRVCWKSETGDNCCRCNNCYRTMLTLDALGVLDRCPTFDRSRLDMGRAARVYCPNVWDVRQFGYVRDLARRRGRADIVAAVERSLARSGRMARRVRRVRALRRLPLAWRVAPALERRMLSGWVR